MSITSKIISAALIAPIITLQGAAAALQVPKGFEELAQGQMVWVDVSLYGDSLGLYQAKVDLENIVFFRPNDIAAAIYQKYGESAPLHELLDKYLPHALSRNGNLSCSTNGQAPGCGYLAPKELAIIFDENEGRVNVFLGQGYLPKKKTSDVFFQATTEASNALIHQQNINFVTDKHYQSIALQGNGSLGVTENGYLDVDWNWNGQRYRNESRQDTEVNNAYFRQDFLKRFYVQAGIMDSRDIFSNAGGSINLSQLPIGKIRGLRTGSTMAWVNRDKVVRGTPVSVFLTQDSRVDAYCDKQLLSSFYLKAGMQELDTRSFPPGSYTVTLRVYEDNQLVRTESVPYTATGDMSFGSFQWFLQGGQLTGDDGRNFNDNKSVVQGGLRLPLTSNLSLTAGSTVLSNVNYWEGAADWTHGFNSGPMDGVLTTRVSYLHGSDGSRGNIQQLSYNDGFSLSFYRSDMQAEDCNSRESRRYSYSGCYKSVNMMLTYPIGQWFTSLGYSLNRNEGRYVYRNQLNDPNNDYGQGAPWEKIYATRTRSRTWQLGVSRLFTFGDFNVNASANAFTRTDSGFNGTDRGGFISLTLTRTTKPGNSEHRNAYSVGSSYQSSRYGRDQFSYNADWSRYANNDSENELGASVYGMNSDTATVSAYGRAGGQYGTGSLTLSDSYDREQSGHRFSTTGNYSSSLMLSRNGLTLGRWGDGNPASALLVNVEGTDEDKHSAVQVSVDTAGQANVNTNSRALFTVPGYTQSTLSITEALDTPAGVGSEIRKGAGQRSLFMVPGKAYQRAIEVQSRYTWLGRMMDQNNHPLEDGIPLNVLSWSPLGGGNFTLGTERPLTRLYIMRDSEFWQCGLHVEAMRDVVRFVGTTHCSSIAMTNLPQAELRAVELMTAGHRTSGDEPVAMSR